jgi:succinate dehydrogenase/fumarate reductase flavoprotein subunit
LSAEQRRIAALMTRPYTGETHARLRLELGTLMDAKVGVYRDGPRLTEALAAIQDLKRRYQSVAVGDKSRVYNQALTFVLELGYMLDCAETTVYSAITRTESRGAHSRTDYPQRDDANWLKHVVIRKQDGGAPAIDFVPVTITKWPPQERTY